MENLKVSSIYLIKTMVLKLGVVKTCPLAYVSKILSTNYNFLQNEVGCGKSYFKVGTDIITFLTFIMIQIISKILNIVA